MPSPFPGMDPYLESPEHWVGFHNALTVCIAGRLNATLPSGFAARVEFSHTNRLVDEVDTTWQRMAGKIRPDVAVESRGPTATLPETVVTRGEQETIADETSGDWDLGFETDYPLPSDDVVELTKVEIVTVSGRHVVTEFEILSPTNKGAGWSSYLAKKHAILQSTTSLVEIDLRVAGVRAVDPPERAVDAFHTDAATPYVVTCYPGWLRSRGVKSFCYPVRLDDRRPTIGVPLTVDRPRHALPMQSIFEQTYDLLGYRALIDYSVPPPCELTPSLRKQVSFMIDEKP